MPQGTPMACRKVKVRFVWIWHSISQTLQNLLILKDAHIKELMMILISQYEYILKKVLN